MLETLRVLAVVAQGAYALFMTALIFIKPIREWLFGLKKKKQEAEDKEAARMVEMKEREDADREGIKCLLRDRITQFYYSHCQQCEIHAYEFENIHLQYKVYKRLGGNSYVDKIYEEICEWNIVK